jgi:hypothetical protein
MITISETFESALLIYDEIVVVMTINEEFQAGMVVYQDAV